LKVSTLELLKGSSLSQLAQQMALRIDTRAPAAGAPGAKVAARAAALRPEDLLTSDAAQIAARLEPDRKQTTHCDQEPRRR
jgi:hypothetical protein